MHVLQILRFFMNNILAWFLPFWFLCACQLTLFLKDRDFSENIYVMYFELNCSSVYTQTYSFNISFLIFSRLRKTITLWGSGFSDVTATISNHPQSETHYIVTWLVPWFMLSEWFCWKPHLHHYLFPFTYKSPHNKLRMGVKGVKNVIKNRLWLYILEEFFTIVK